MDQAPNTTILPPMPPQGSSGTNLGGQKYFIIFLFVALAIGVAIALSSLASKPAPVAVGDNAVVGLRISTDAAEQLIAVDPVSVTVQTVGDAPAGVLKNRFSVPTPEGTVSVDSSGIILTNASGKKTIVASAAVPRDHTPIAVSKSGDMVAWVAPADRSLQIFRRSAKGVYMPIHLGPKSQVASLAFTPDGAYLVTTLATIDAGTEIRALNLTTGASTTIATSPDLIIVINQYE